MGPPLTPEVESDGPLGRGRRTARSGTRSCGHRRLSPGCRSARAHVTLAHHETCPRPDPVGRGHDVHRSVPVAVLTEAVEPASAADNPSGQPLRHTVDRHPDPDKPASSRSGNVSGCSATADTDDEHEAHDGDNGGLHPGDDRGVATLITPGGGHHLCSNRASSRYSSDFTPRSQTLTFSWVELHRVTIGGPLSSAPEAAAEWLCIDTTGILSSGPHVAVLHPVLSQRSRLLRFPVTSDDS